MVCSRGRGMELPCSAHQPVHLVCQSPRRCRWYAGDAGEEGAALIAAPVRSSYQRNMIGPFQSFAQRVSAYLFKSSPKFRRNMTELVTRDFEALTYERLVEHGFRPAGIIDVGAYRGDWTRLANRVFGPTPTLMVEAQPGLSNELAPVLADLPQAKLASALLSEQAGTAITFQEMGTGSSFLSELSDARRHTIVLTSSTLDEVADEFIPNLSPLFLKIDVQGAELHVLRGGGRTLSRAEVVQLEVAMLQYNDGAPLLPEVVAFMAEQGFLPVEVSGFSRPRSYLVQIDLLFARRDSALRPGSFRFD